ncbi:MAG: cytochrome c oxidase subunit II, partial [Verrucomicrobiota bacterium]
MSPARFHIASALLCVGFGTGCRGRQSALEPAGRGAEQLADLFWWMTAGAAVVWLGVAALTFYALRVRHENASAERRAKLLIIGGGVVVPTVVLAALLTYGLSILPGLLAPAKPGSLKIAVVGEQWWWRVRYQLPGAEPLETANEVRLPVGEVVEFELSSPDVIHAFWIPSLGGKMDMIPGRKTRLTLEPTRTGTFRGVCAEYCGASHALMAFDVVVMEKEAFARWLEEQRQPARAPETERERSGHERFFKNGCAACHAVRGTEARGHMGPELTRVGARGSIGAGILPNDTDGFTRWLERTDKVKPGVLMPHYGMLPKEEVRIMAEYL